MQTCTQEGMHRVIGMSLHTASLHFSIWAGPRVGLRLQRYWLGYVLVVLLVVAGGGELGLAWISDHLIASDNQTDYLFLLEANRGGIDAGPGKAKPQSLYLDDSGRL